MAWTFSMVCVAWVFFRAESVGEAVEYLLRMKEFNSTVPPLNWDFLLGAFAISCCVLLEFLPRPKSLIIQDWELAVLLILTILCSQSNNAEFIYFQF